MKVWVHFWHYITKKTAYDRAFTKKQHTQKTPDNIYDEKGTFKDYIDKQRQIHGFFKYLFLKPGLLFAKWILGKHLESTVPNKPHYKNVQIFNNTFNRTVLEWVDKCLGGINTGIPIQTEERIVAHLKSDSVEMLNLMKNILLTVVKNDTAYFEFLNLLMFNITMEMNKGYDHSEISHVLYNSSRIDDVRYFLVTGFIDSLQLNEVLAGMNYKTGEIYDKGKKSNTATKT